MNQITPGIILTRKEINRRCYLKQREKRLLKTKLYYLTHKEEKAIYDKTRPKRDRTAYNQSDAGKAVRKKWLLKNKARIQRYSKKQREINKNKIYMRNSLWRAKRHNMEGSFTFEDWARLKELYDFTCPKCYRKEPDIILTQDHIIPISKGGNNFIENIQPLCRGCNASKSDNFIIYERMVYLTC